MIIYALIFTILAISSFLYYRIAARLGIVDNPNVRSSHTNPTIRGGGILFYISILLYEVFNGLVDFYFFLGITMVAIISFIDDIVSLSARMRLIFHFLALGLVLYQIGVWVESPILFITMCFVGVLFINLNNFMDGINGMTALTGLITCVTLILITVSYTIPNQNILIYMILALGVFSFYNIRKKALFFAGDVGSITLALFFFYILTLIFLSHSSPAIYLLSGVFLADAGYTIVVRAKKGEKISEPHRSHLYEILANNLKWPHLRISVMYALIQVGINFGVYYALSLPYHIQWGVLTIGLVVLGACYFLGLGKALKKYQLLEDSV